MRGSKQEHLMTQYDHEAAVAIFIRTNGVTRCPTACVGPTQGFPDAADQAALEQYAIARNQSWRMKMARQRSAHIIRDAAMGQQMDLFRDICGDLHFCGPTARRLPTRLCL
jgi:hypothetical protein